MAPLKDELSFSRPPVQQVTLSIFFKPEPSLRVFHLFAVLSAWISDYPKLEELPPSPPWRNIAAEEVDNLADQSVSLWPTPLFVMHSEDGQRSLRIQQDRFEHVWRFEAIDSPKGYVGYENLRTELEARFSEFQQIIREAADVEITPERSDATYQNLVDYSHRDFCVGVLTDWSNTKASESIASVYTGMRFAGFGEDKEGTETLVSIEPGPDGAGTDLTIDVQCEILDGATYLDSLDVAHTTVLHRFQSLSSEELRASWGEQ